MSPAAPILEPTPPENTGKIVLYRTEDGRTRIECRFAEGTIWLTQALIADLYQTSIPNVNIHLKHICAERELNEEATIKDYLIVRQEGEDSPRPSSPPCRTRPPPKPRGNYSTASNSPSRGRQADRAQGVGNL